MGYLPHPNGEVLSIDTGFPRNYERDPYGNYYELNNSDIFFPVDNTSSLYQEKAIVYGLEVNGQFKAYAEEELKKITIAQDSFAVVDIEIRYNSENNTAQFIDVSSEEEIVPVFGFWFSWFSVHPDTLIFEAS